ncbi:hypothetical protein [Arthrobacter sp. M4]|uniref:hypothetical protein n=1 Tax=Arthrobacter sp. M4 TaxID=218160 RepID=UPI001CDB56C0|nr:hypothetical protein [Arthrobacter sp. M4]MCA4135173.1 hypothetical protein [Arthrobacter sp. M4]
MTNVQDPQVMARDLLRTTEMTLMGLWLRFWGYGGQAGYMEFDAYIHGVGSMSPGDIDLLRRAIEDLADE